jgi:hypothetical protein
MPRGKRLPEGYDRLVMVAVGCPECSAPRGLPCTSLIVTTKNDGTTRRPHIFRRFAFEGWRELHPSAFARLSVQVPVKPEFAVEGLAC